MIKGKMGALCLIKKQRVPIFCLAEIALLMYDREDSCMIDRIEKIKIKEIKIKEHTDEYFKRRTLEPRFW